MTEDATLTPEQRAYRQKLHDTLERLQKLPLHRLDGDTLLLEAAFGTAYDAGLFDLHAYPPALQNALKFDLFATLPAASGSLAFLAVQILAANRIMQSNGFAEAERYYRRRCGIAVNHLRAPRTVVGSEKAGGRYRLSGRLTWASGYGIFDSLVIGFHHEGEELQAVVPFAPQPGFAIGAPAETFVGASLNTVDIDLDHYEVPEEQIVSAHPIGHYTRQKSVSKTVHFALYGLGLGAVDALEDDDVKREAARRLEMQKEAFMATDDGETMDRLRITLFALVREIVTTGMILRGGSSILSERRLQRYYRELILFNSNGLNDTIKGLFKAAFLQP